MKIKFIQKKLKWLSLSHGLLTHRTTLNELLFTRVKVFFTTYNKPKFLNHIKNFLDQPQLLSKISSLNS